LANIIEQKEQQPVPNPAILVIRATWDDVSRVWVAESDDIPGLITESDHEDALISKLRLMVPELLELNESPVRNRPLEILIKFCREERISVPVAA
jgi:hypothetical protein